MRFPAPTRTITFAATDTETIAVYNGHKVGAVWGPAVEGDWFAMRINDHPVRVRTRQQADAHLQALTVMPLPAELETPAPGCGCWSEPITRDRSWTVACLAHGGQRFPLPSEVH